ncbi:MAG: hypothetical protein K6C95_04025 [Lachnospiraceae bacterium]|nr:hypothetical protein [Lachnospiraceae bacterium]
MKQDTITQSRTNNDSRIYLRSYYLRLLKHWYLPAAACAVCAVIGAVSYFCAHTIFGPAREYAAGARLYLEFSADAAGNAMDYYNAWTWKDLMTDEEIMGYVMNTLYEKGLTDISQTDPEVIRSDGTTATIENDELILKPGPMDDAYITRARVQSSMTVKLPSDLRLMMLTVTDHDRETADAILEALTGALTAYGDSNPVFLKIRLLEISPAVLLVSADHTGQAALLGAITGLILSIFMILLWHASDDACYEPEMCERRFGIRVLGTLPSDRSRLHARNDDLRSRLESELSKACSTVLSDGGHIALIAADPAKDTGHHVCGILTDILGEHFLDGKCSFYSGDQPADVDRGGKVLLCIPSGRRICAYADHLISGLNTREADIAGIIFYDADLDHLRILYGFRL